MTASPDNASLNAYLVGRLRALSDGLGDDLRAAATAIESIARDLHEARRIAEEWRDGYQATYPDLPRVPLPWEP